MCLIVQLKMKSHFLTHLTFLSKLWQLTFQVCLCMKVCLSFFVLNIRRLLNSFLSLPLSFSLSFSLWVILSIFPSSCSVTTWHGFDFYAHAAQTPTAECVYVCVLNLSLIPRFHPVDSLQRMQVLCDLFCLCPGSAGDPSWPSLIQTITDV